jgi:hypothetical protein
MGVTICLLLFVIAPMTSFFTVCHNESDCSFLNIYGTHRCIDFFCQLGDYYTQDETLHSNTTTRITSTISTTTTKTATTRLEDYYKRDYTTSEAITSSTKITTSTTTTTTTTTTTIQIEETSQSMR